MAKGKITYKETFEGFDKGMENLDKMISSINENLKKSAENIKKTVKGTDVGDTATINKLLKQIETLEKKQQKLNATKIKSQKITKDGNALRFKTLKINRKAIKLTHDEALAVERAKIKQQRYRKELKKTAMAQMTAVKTTNTYGKALKSFAFKFNFLGNAMSSLALGAGAALTGALKNGLEIINKYSKSNSKLASILGTTKDKMTELMDASQKLGGITKFTATEIVGLQTEYAKLGFSTEEILKATEATLNLAAATDGELARTAEIAGATLRGFGLDASDMNRVTDIMAASFSKSALDLESFAESMKLVAPIAKAANIPIETTTALLGKLADSGLKGSIGGTALKNMLIHLTDGNSKLSKSLGYTVKNSDDLFKAFNDLKKGTVDVSTAVRLTDKRSAAAFVTFANGVKSAEDLTEALNDVDGAAKRMSDTMQNNLAGDVTLLKSAWEGLIIEIYKGDGVMSNFFRGVVKGFTDTLERLKNADMTPQAFANMKKMEAVQESLAAQRQRDKTEFRKHLINLKMEGKSYDELRSVKVQFLTVDVKRLKYLEKIKKKQKGLNEVGEMEILSLKSRIVEVLTYNKITESSTQIIEEKTELTKEEIKAIEKASKAEKQRADAQAKRDANWFKDSQKRYSLINELREANEEIDSRVPAYTGMGFDSMPARTDEIPDFSGEDAANKKRLEREKAYQEEFKKSVADTVNYVIAEYGKMYDEQLNRAKRRTDLLNADLEQQATIIQAEIQLNEYGNASNIQSEQNKYNLIKQQRDKSVAEENEAQKKRDKIAQAQLAMNALLQVSNTVVAITKVFNQNASLGPWGWAAAIAQVGVMLASIATFASQAKTGYADGGFSEDGGFTGKGGKYQTQNNLGNKSYEYHGGEFIADNQLTNSHHDSFEMMHNRANPYEVVEQLAREYGILGNNSTGTDNGLLQAIATNTQKQKANENVFNDKGRLIIKRTGNLTKKYIN